jgi:signal peptidase I
MDQNKLKNNKFINITGAIVFTFLTIGLGQISCGKIRRGICFYLFKFMVIYIVIYVSIMPIKPFNILVAVILFLSFYIYIIFDVIKLSMNPKNTLNLNPIIGYLILIGIWQLNSSLIIPQIKQIVEKNYFQIYKISSNAMRSSLLIGDIVSATKFFIHSKIKYGDIIIYKNNIDNKNYIRRVIAFAGDEIEIKSGILYLNGNKYLTNYNVKMHFHNNEYMNGPSSAFIVPKEVVVVISDNYIDSCKKQIIGLVKKQYIKAKIINVYWSWGKKWKDIRWNRIGLAVNQVGK